MAVSQHLFTCTYSGLLQILPLLFYRGLCLLGLECLKTVIQGKLEGFFSFLHFYSFATSNLTLGFFCLFLSANLILNFPTTRWWSEPISALRLTQTSCKHLCFSNAVLLLCGRFGSQFGGLVYPSGFVACSVCVGKVYLQ